MIRKANSEDLETLVKIAREVANELHQQGIDQWSETYPDLEHFRNDLIKGGLFVYCHDLEIVGSISVLPENDPFYLELKWRFDNAYVVHRLMVKPEYRQMHIGRKLFLHAIDHAKSMRADGMKVDTHPDNYRMQSLILSLGFEEVGYINAMNRIGYELPFAENITRR